MTDLKTEQRSAADALWDRLRRDNNIDARNLLVEHYLYLVKSIVFRMMPNYQSFANFDDLISCGVLGLMDAIDKFDLTREVKFETYAYMRIRGEIIDYLRKQDWAPSSLRRQISSITKTFDSMEMELGRQVSEEEVAEKLDMPVKDLRAVLEKSYMFNLLYFEDTLQENFSAGAALSTSEGLPHAQLEREEISGALSELIESLPKNEKTVVTLYYFEEMPLKDIAKVLGISPSRVSQIHSKVLIKLRKKLEGVFPRD